MTTKKCATCARVLPLTDYHRDGGTADGYKASCKPCRNERQRRWRMREQLKSQSVAELRKLASDAGIERYAALRKEDLIETLIDTMSDKPTETGDVVQLHIPHTVDSLLHAVAKEVDMLRRERDEARAEVKKMQKQMSAYEALRGALQLVSEGV